jgi:hypothetical protein
MKQYKLLLKEIEFNELEVYTNGEEEYIRIGYKFTYRRTGGKKDFNGYIDFDYYKDRKEMFISITNYQDKLKYRQINKQIENEKMEERIKNDFKENRFSIINKGIKINEYIK